jgi:hypothetical protein
VILPSFAVIVVVVVGIAVVGIAVVEIVAGIADGDNRQMPDIMASLPPSTIP